MELPSHLHGIGVGPGTGSWAWGKTKAISPNKLCSGSLVLVPSLGHGFMEIRDFFDIQLFFGLWGLGYQFFFFLRGAPGEAPAAVVSSSVVAVSSS
jgi:hypothetical protein